MAHALWQHGNNAGVTSARDVPDEDEMWGRAAWSTVATPGDRIVWQAIETFGASHALEQMWEGDSHARIRRLAEILDVSPREIVAFRRRYPHPPGEDTLGYVRRLARKMNLSLFAPGSSKWPERLLDLGPYQPIILFGAGSADFLATVSTLGIVGSRSPSPNGLEAARAIVREAIDCGYALVSGGARGIDWVGHDIAAARHTPQVMVLATASDRLGSWQAQMVQQVSRCGVVVTETPPGHAITPASFLHRNRVIAALSDRVVVVEAAERSGSLNTASHAKTLGRDLSAVVSRPQDEKNAGCYRLVEEWGADRYQLSA